MVLNQPNCQFIPRAFVLYPKYYDGKDYKETGQKFVVTNTASFNHNTKIVGGEKNGTQDAIIKPGEKKEYVFQPEAKPLQISCSYHGWMGGRVFALDHPFAAVTDKNGNFEIKNAPSDVELTVIGWHEAKGDFHDAKMTFKKGDNPSLELKVKK